MRVLVVDVGGSSIKLKLWQGRQSSSFPSGRHLSAEDATRCILTLTATWKYGAVCKVAASTRPAWATVVIRRESIETHDAIVTRAT